MIDLWTAQAFTGDEISQKLTDLGFTMKSVGTTVASSVAASVVQSGPAYQFAGGPAAAVQPEAPLQPGQHYQFGPGAVEAITPEAALQPGQHYQFGPGAGPDLLNPNGNWLDMLSIPLHMPLPSLNSSYSPITYAGHSASGTTVNIINPTFRNPNDANAIIDLVRNSL